MDAHLANVFPLVRQAVHLAVWCCVLSVNHSAFDMRLTLSKNAPALALKRPGTFNPGSYFRRTILVGSDSFVSPPLRFKPASHYVGKCRRIFILSAPSSMSVRHSDKGGETIRCLFIRACFITPHGYSYGLSSS